MKKELDLRDNNELIPNEEKSDKKIYGIELLVRYAGGTDQEIVKLCFLGRE